MNLTPSARLEGDLVWSRDETTDAQALRRVLRTFVTPDQPMLELRLEGAAQAEILKVTSGHPFWTRDHGWVAAGQLRPGAQILQRSGGWIRLTGATWAQQRAAVYNFEVEGYHSYFVGNHGAWVHNTCAGAARGAAPSSRALGRAREAAGHVRPPESAAHHLVAGGAGKAGPARAALEKFGIGINDAANGVFLRQGVHSGIHTNAYYDAVNTALQKATTRAEALEVLDAVRQRLLNGGFP